MSKHAKHVPTHRGTPKHAHLAQAPKSALRTTMVLTSVAAAATGVTVAGGVYGSGALDSASADLSASGADVPAADTAGSGANAGTEVEAATLGDREPVVSRSDQRDQADPVKESALGGDASQVQAMTETESLSDADPRDIARALLPEFGFSSDQFGCLDSLWTRESGWSTTADNPSSSAYGIPQALPGEKMASEGSDWATNPVTQIRWGLGYIQDRYGSPCGAWGHSESSGWY